MTRASHARSRTAGALALLALAAAPTHGQPTRDTSAVRPDTFCWRGRPLPHCRAFVLFELGYFEALATTRLREVTPPPFEGQRDEIDFGRQLSWTVGAMRNLDARTAVGGAVVVGAALEQGPYVAGTARWRRWTGTRTSVELAAGPGAAQVLTPLAEVQPGGYQGDVWRPAAVAEARANLADLAALSVRGIVVPRVGDRTPAALFVGASTGSTAAAIGTVGIGAIVALAIAALGNSY